MTFWGKFSFILLKDNLMEIGTLYFAISENTKIANHNQEQVLTRILERGITLVQKYRLGEEFELKSLILY